LHRRVFFRKLEGLFTLNTLLARLELFFELAFACKQTRIICDLSEKTIQHVSVAIILWQTKVAVLEKDHAGMSVRADFGRWFLTEFLGYIGTVLYKIANQCTAVRKN
jgi:hypothetical protein